jgi:SAM-dependent methyltransferase
MPRPKAKPYPNRRTMASRADRHILYTRAVQSVDAEIDFVEETFRTIRRRRPARLREDFCGTAASACEWVRRRAAHTAIGVDLDRATLEWGVEHNLSRLSPAARRRLRLANRNVLDPGPGAGRMDVVLAMNFSWWTFKTRRDLGEYFRAVRRSLVRDGVFFLDIYGGWESLKPQTDRRQVGGKTRGFTYLWQQTECDAVNNTTTCYIHFRFPDGSRLRRAFRYDWRVWTIPETRELLADCGFSRTTVYWEGEEPDGEGNGIFTPAEHGECCPSFIAYIVAER